LSLLAFAGKRSVQDFEFTNSDRLTMKLFLEFVPEQTTVHRKRLSYAFRLFCAIYGHHPIENAEEGQADDVCITYSSRRKGDDRRKTLKLANLYWPRPLGSPAPRPTTFEEQSESTVLFHAPPTGERPDWLGEIFEWVSCADEYSIRNLDSVGRVPFSESYICRHELDPRKPYAAIAMEFLQLALCELVPHSSPVPVSPAGGSTHFIVNTHDVDFVPIRPLDSLKRLAKNAVISLAIYKSPFCALSQVDKLLAMMLSKQDVLDQLPGLLAMEAQARIPATYFFLCRKAHPRDGNYRIEQPMVLNLMHSLASQGMEIGLHGSYTSVDNPETLSSEFDRLRKQGFEALGARQHWLRFTLRRLIPALERSEALYDASIGWQDQIGFRACACFPFPPYNFECECASTFLELPLVVMEESLVHARVPQREWFDCVAEVLRASRRYGWGGLSVLWHPNAFGGGQLPEAIGEVFYELVKRREEWRDTWVSAFGLVRSVRQRFSEVGLLPSPKWSAWCEL
jgi:hypothetical protein